MARQLSSPDELEAAIVAAAAEVRWVYLRDAGSTAPPVRDDWQATVAPHHVIAALVTEVRKLQEVLAAERTARRAAEDAVGGLLAAARAVVAQADRAAPATLFDEGPVR